MKILYHIPYPSGIGDDRTNYEGYEYAFKGLGHEFFALTERDDLGERLRAVQPDLLMGSLSLVDPCRVAPILKTYRRAGGKVLLRLGWLDRREHRELIRLIRDDMLADIYVSELELPQFSSLTGKEAHLLPWAASRKYHFPVPPIKKYECDILFIGARLPKKSELFERRLFPLTTKYNVKIFGTGWDAFDKYALRTLSKIERRVSGTGFFSNWRIRRQVPYEEENQAYASAKISLNFHEKQPGGLILLNGRTFKIPASGGFEICDWVPLARRYFREDELVMVKNDDEFFTKIDYYLGHDDERKAIQERGTARALQEHTYHNRAEEIVGWYLTAP